VGRTLQEPLNPNATTTFPATLSPSPVAEATVRQVATDDVEAPTDVGYNDTNLHHVQDEQAELVRREKEACKQRKAGDRHVRDSRLTASLAQTQDIGTPRDAGKRSTVQTTCMDGLMPTGADRQAEVGQGVFTNPGGEEGRQRKRKSAPANEQLEMLQEASRLRILPPADPAETPASGRTAGELARLFQQSANFSAQPAGGDLNFLSPTGGQCSGKDAETGQEYPRAATRGTLGLSPCTHTAENIIRSARGHERIQACGGTGARGAMGP
jgi:hypothetical protein